MKNIYKYFKSILLIFALSFNVRHSPLKHLLKIYWLLWTAVPISMGYLYKIKVINFNEKYEKSLLVNATEFYVGQLAHLTILFEALWKWKGEKQFFDMIQSTDKIIEKCLTFRKGISDEIFQKILPFFGTTTLIFSIWYGFALSYSRYFYDWALSLPINITTHFLYFQFTFYLFHILLRLQYLNAILKQNRMSLNELDTNALEDIYINILEMAKIFNARFFWSIGFYFLYEYANLLVETYWIVNYFNRSGMYIICKNFTFLNKYKV